MTQTGSEPVAAKVAPPVEAPDVAAEEAAEHSPLATSPIAQAGLGLVAAAFGAIALSDANGLDIFGKKGVPGPGFFPVTLSVAVIALGLLLVAVSVIRGVRHGLGPAGQMRGVSKQLLRAAYVWVGFLVGVALMPLIGFVPATILLIAYLVLVIERIRNIRSVLVIVAVPLVAYALFVFVLGVELPTSVLFEGP
jgi:putative tricarboxylic transport membrane protein